MKRDPLCRGEFTLFPVDPKPQPAEVTEHRVPVFAQLCSRLGQYEPVIEVVENANASFPQRNTGCLHDLGEDTRRQGQPEGEDLVLICSPFDRKVKKRSVSREDRDMKVRVLQADCCEPIEGTNALKDELLHPERELMKGSVQVPRSKIGRKPPLFLGTRK